MCNSRGLLLRLKTGRVCHPWRAGLDDGAATLDRITARLRHPLGDLAVDPPSAGLTELQRDQGVAAGQLLSGSGTAGVTCVSSKEDRAMWLALIATSSGSPPLDLSGGWLSSTAFPVRTNAQMFTRTFVQVWFSTRYRPAQAGEVRTVGLICLARPRVS